MGLFPFQLPVELECGGTTSWRKNLWSFHHPRQRPMLFGFITHWSLLLATRTHPQALLTPPPFSAPTFVPTAAVVGVVLSLLGGRGVTLLVTKASVPSLVRALKYPPTRCVI